MSWGGIVTISVAVGVVLLALVAVSLYRRNARHDRLSERRRRSQIRSELWDLLFTRRYRKRITYRKNSANE